MPNKRRHDLIEQDKNSSPIAGARGGEIILYNAPDGISDFSKAFKPWGAIVMNRDFTGEAMSGTTTVTFLPTAAILARPDLFRELLRNAFH